MVAKKHRQRPADDAKEYLGILLDLFDGPFAMLTACLDESQSGEVFCVCGVMFDRKSLKALDREWKRELQRSGVRYFHAVECAHGKRQFEGADNDSRMNVYRRMAEIVGRHIIGSATVASLPWLRTFNKADWGYSAYTVCAYLCMDQICELADYLERKRRVAFFIEDGHPRMGELRNLLRSQIGAGRKDIVRYNFSGKHGFRAVQAADVFTYEVCRRIGEKSKEPNKPTLTAIRKSLLAMVHAPDPEVHQVLHLDDKRQKVFANLLKGKF